MSESDLVNAFNGFFRDNEPEGISVRKKQSRFQSQHFDILVMSKDLGDIIIEHKSYKTESSNKLYFSQHFSDDTNGDELGAGHQIERIQEFCDRAGKPGWLAVEIKRGRGTGRECYFVPWEQIYEMYWDWKNDKDDAEAGFSREWFRKHGIQIERDTDKDGNYKIPKDLFRH